MQKGGTDADDNDSYFTAEDVGNGQIAIRNLKENKYLKKPNRLIQAKSDNDCGEACHFNLVDFSSSTTSSTSGYSIYVTFLKIMFVRTLTICEDFISSNTLNFLILQIDGQHNTTCNTIPRWILY